MRKLTATLFVACLMAPPLSFAQDADDEREREAARDLGAVLAWRLGPEVVEERCQGPDPGGNETRRDALKTWHEKNAALIKTIDERVAEVAPLIVPPSKKADAVNASRNQVKAILMEALFSGTPEDVAAFCKSEADAKSTRWTRNGETQLQNSLAALYDWKMLKGGK
jgi:hypothetical protein